MLHIPIVHAHDVSKQIPRVKKNFHRVENVIKQLVHTSALRSSICEPLKKLELLEATPRATLTHLLCSPNFPHASDLDERTLTFEPIVKLLAFGVARQHHYCNDLGLKLNLNLFR